MKYDPTKALEKIYLNYAGVFPLSITPLALSGSNRKYFRLQGNYNSVIGVIGSDIDENRAFFYLTNHFAGKNLPVPKLLKVSEDETTYLLSDLGNQSLFELLHDTDWEKNNTSGIKDIVSQTFDTLISFQVEGIKGLETTMCYPKDEFDKQSILWDLNYFKYCFLKPSEVNFHEAKLEEEFNALADMLLKAPSNFFMYRDFQSRNIMVHNNTPYFIDYQGGRKGPCLYDVASFLYQARANFPQRIRDDIFATYLGKLSTIINIDEALHKNLYPAFILFRSLQTLGAYGYRGFFERKCHFLSSIPMASSNAFQIVNQVPLALPHITNILRAIAQKYSIEGGEINSYNGLTVHISSFSFKKGYPHEHPEHGGGFVFDCRGLPNPGRLPEYASQTGLDDSVANFLGKQREVEKFFDKTLSIIRETIDVYKTRGFHHLSISFGCTGGQHRSVYLASRTSEIINKIDGLRVVVVHRELEL
jgi:aminoglycoside/choline kinase family phosphotransferase